uniref:Putative permeases n=1 Tax=uncultured bacterium Contig575 TaxID=1393592 RepID=W0FHV6_9BACT|nr:putative permeases [uncultured bacterium Contig575]
MTDWIRREAVYLWYYLDILVRQIAPYWALGILLGSAVSVFGKKRIHGAFARIGRKRMGWLGVIPASLLGIASPLCMYGTIPIAASFSEQGVEDDYLAAFMMSSILLNPQLIFYSGALGGTAAGIRCVSCAVCGCVAGWLVRLFYGRRGKGFFDFTGFHEGASRDTDPNLPVRFLKNAWRNVRATGPMFALGILLTALYQIHVPPEFVGGLFGKNEGFGVLMAATIGVPLYMCGGGTIPLLQQWLADGMSMGSAAAFMITGPATKLTNLGAMKIVLGWKRFALYILFAMAFAWGTGVAVNAF